MEVSVNELVITAPFRGKYDYIGLADGCKGEKFGLIGLILEDEREP